ncbi:MAG: hypothetical protein KF715_08445 [Candidatus Didemnitutus sp.]|nr:hypothetical protein [Candidatus Didemnitutus sp.]
MKTITFRTGFLALALTALLTLAACAHKGPTLPAPIPVEFEQAPGTAPVPSGK